MQAGLAARPLTKGRTSGRVVVDSAYAENASTGGFTGQVPLDNTIPQITEGDQIIQLSYTPKSATNRLRIRFDSSVAASGPGGVTAAIFVGSGVNAVRARAQTVDVRAETVGAVWEGVAGTAAAITIQVRMGANAAITYWINALNGSFPLYGGVSAATLFVEELTP